MRRLTFLLPLALAACTTLTRSPRSGYASGPTNDAAEREYFGRDARLARDAREELGLGERPLNSAEQNALDLRVRLKRAEESIPNRRDRRLYYKTRSSLTSDADRLRVLALPGPAARARFVNAYGLDAIDENRAEELAATIEAKDIAIGMTQKSVSESWGDPDQVETAGNTVYGVERWRYHRFVSGGDGFRKETRLVYFEGGRVSGWERP